MDTTEKEVEIDEMEVTFSTVNTSAVFMPRSSLGLVAVSPKITVLESIPHAQPPPKENTQEQVYLGRNRPEEKKEDELMGLLKQRVVELENLLLKNHKEMECLIDQNNLLKSENASLHVELSNAKRVVPVQPPIIVQAPAQVVEKIERIEVQKVVKVPLSGVCSNILEQNAKLYAKVGAQIDFYKDKLKIDPSSLSSLIQTLENYDKRLHGAYQSEELLFKDIAVYESLLKSFHELLDPIKHLVEESFTFPEKIAKLKEEHAIQIENMKKQLTDIKHDAVLEAQKNKSEAEILKNDILTLKSQMLSKDMESISRAASPLPVIHINDNAQSSSRVDETRRTVLFANEREYVQDEKLQKKFNELEKERVLALDRLRRHLRMSESYDDLLHLIDIVIEQNSSREPVQVEKGVYFDFICLTNYYSRSG